MAIVSNNDIDKYNNQGGNFFGLQDDGDKAVVRFLHEGTDDISRVAVHDVTIDGRTRKVNCIRDYSQPIADCPLCKSGARIGVRIFLELLVYETDKQGNPTGKSSVQIWERGKKFNLKLNSLCNRHKPLCDTVFEIERIGKKGSTETTYEIYPLDVNKEDYPFTLPEEPYNPIGGIVLDKSYDELGYYVENRKFPPQDNEDSEVERRPVRAVESAPVRQVTSEQPTTHSQPVSQPTTRRRI